MSRKGQETDREFRHRVKRPGRAERRSARPGVLESRGGVMGVFKGRNPFGFLFGSSRREHFLARYVLREHARGRPLAEILDDPYVRNWSTPEQRARLLDEPEVVAALGEDSLEELRLAVRNAA
jgi:hypothetical protein